MFIGSQAIDLGELEINGCNIFAELIGNSFWVIGIEEKTGYYIASLERAFLDAVHVYQNYHFDNLSPLDWEKVEELKGIYENKAMEKRVEGYRKMRN